MTRVKVAEATGPVLDWIVAKAEGLSYRYDDKYGPMCFRPSTTKGTVQWDSAPLPYSTDWSQGGPIIEREKIDLCWSPGRTACMATISVLWPKELDCGLRCVSMVGPTPLIAAMRCFVASKLGDEVDVPEELL